MGPHDDVAAVSHHADIGPVPRAAPCTGALGACTLRFQARHVILVNRDTARLKVRNARSGRYVSQQVLTTPVGSLSFDRGWATVDGSLAGRPFRFADTHLETGPPPRFRRHRVESSSLR